ncbi:MAG TPA: thiol reductase thioredoxin [Desulfobulbaceae bacterium]|nr:MAG: thiol reductase thioredoxin [Deltaproteobacteria bacterium RIFOXYD12_FULL_53_23]HCC54016.1 thiol reductase thioredoxin [Desulfobulbaceae bacterium]
MKKIIRFTLLLVALAILPASAGLAAGPPVPVPNMVTMIDLGATSCIPCKMMAPILTELEAEYRGKAAIIFIDVWQNPEEGKKFKISMIPTQIFFDQNGTEMFRHLGFMDKKTIVAQLAKMGVVQPAAGKGK